MAKRHRKPLGAEVFCFNCHQFRPYYTEIERCDEFLPVARRRTVKVVFPQLVARCDWCGEEVYVPTIHDQNMEVRRTAGMKALYQEASKEECEQ